ncbi:DUF4113 domain-containing protein [Methylorubrum thiocyanatum]|uniref:DUF4113 domain-containing protein n=1 Tax=Methylorubrum thiocyanatum TaxID=47958 RepID=UPI003F534508
MRLMAALDASNVRWGRGSVVPARAGLERQRTTWTTKVDMMTPSYTTRWTHSRLLTRDAG